MCGIIYIKRNPTNKYGDISKPLLEIYKEQKDRGSSGFGFVAIDSDRTIIDYQKRTTEKDITKLLEDCGDAKEILFHHRYPTSTENIIETAHPFFISNDYLKYNYYVVHNGGISNADKVKEYHNKIGIEYKSELDYWREVKDTTTQEGYRLEHMYSKFNDSEAFANDICRYIEGLDRKVESIGNASFIAVAVNKETNKVDYLYFGRNEGRPLLVTKEYFNTIISSESKSKTCEDINAGDMWKYSYEEDTITRMLFPIEVHDKVTDKIFNGNNF